MAVRLSEYPIKFPQLEKSTGIYFDDINRQLFIARDGKSRIDIISITPYRETFLWCVCGAVCLFLLSPCTHLKVTRASLTLYLQPEGS
jgi:hypothetical protein